MSVDLYESFKRGYQLGAQGLPYLVAAGSPAPESIPDYRRGWEAGVAAFRLAMGSEARRLGFHSPPASVEALAYAILDKAIGWWKGHRPISWTQADHLDNPTINAHATDRDAELAAAVGAWLAELGEPIP